MNIQVELSSGEVEVLEKALESWEKEATGVALSGSLLSMMLTPRAERDSVQSEMEKSMNDAADENARRKRVSTLLRAKLYQASAKLSEHVEAR